MIKIIFITFKVVTAVALVLILGQIRVGEKSISNYVHDFVEMPIVQKPILWVAARIDHRDRNLVAKDAKDKESSTAKTQTSGRLKEDTSREPSNDDRDRLSGLLK